MAEAPVERSIAPANRQFGLVESSVYEKYAAVPVAVESALEWGVDPLLSLASHGYRIGNEATSAYDRYESAAAGELSEALDLTPPQAFESRLTEYKQLYPSQTINDWGKQARQRREQFYVDATHGGGRDYLYNKAGILGPPAAVIGGVAGVAAQALGFFPKTISAAYTGAMKVLPGVNPYLQNMVASGALGAVFSLPHAVVSGFNEDGYDFGEAAKNLGIGTLAGAGLGAAAHGVIENFPKAIDLVTQTIKAIADRRKQSDVTQTMAQISKQRFAQMQAAMQQQQVQLETHARILKGRAEENVQAPQPVPTEKTHSIGYAAVRKVQHQLRQASSRHKANVSGIEARRAKLNEDIRGVDIKSEEYINLNKEDAKLREDLINEIDVASRTAKAGAQPEEQLIKEFPSDAQIAERRRIEKAQAKRKAKHNPKRPVRVNPGVVTKKAPQVGVHVYETPNQGASITTDKQGRIRSTTFANKAEQTGAADVPHLDVPVKPAPKYSATVPLQEPVKEQPSVSPYAKTHAASEGDKEFRSVLAVVQRANHAIGIRLSAWKTDLPKYVSGLKNAFDPLSKEISKIKKGSIEHVALRTGNTKGLSPTQQESISNAQEIFRGMYAKLQKLGYDLPEQRSTYFPSFVKDPKGLAKYFVRIGRSDIAKKIETKFAEIQSEIGQHGDEGLMRFNTSLDKERTIPDELITSEMMKFYATSAEALDAYINKTANALAEGKFFKDKNPYATVAERVMNLVNKHTKPISEMTPKDMESRVTTYDHLVRLFASKGYQETPIAKLARGGNVIFMLSGIPTITKNILFPLVESTALFGPDVVVRGAKKFFDPKFNITSTGLAHITQAYMDDTMLGKLDLVSTGYGLRHLPGKIVDTMYTGLSHGSNFIEAKKRYIDAYLHIVEEAGKDKAPHNLQEFLYRNFTPARISALRRASRKAISGKPLTLAEDRILLQAAELHAGERVPTSKADRPFNALKEPTKHLAGRVQQDLGGLRFGLRTFQNKFNEDVIRTKIVEEFKAGRHENAMKNLAGLMYVFAAEAAISNYLIDPVMNKDIGKTSAQKTESYFKHLVTTAIGSAVYMDSRVVGTIAEGLEGKDIKRKLSETATNIAAPGSGSSLGIMIDTAHFMLNRYADKKGGMRVLWDTLNPALNPGAKYLYKPAEPLFNRGLSIEQGVKTGDWFAEKSNVERNTREYNESQTPEAKQVKKDAQAEAKKHTGAGSIVLTKQKEQVTKALKETARYGTVEQGTVSKAEAQSRYNYEVSWLKIQIINEELRQGIRTDRRAAQREKRILMRDNPMI